MDNKSIVMMIILLMEPDSCVI